MRDGNPREGARDYRFGRVGGRSSKSEKTRRGTDEAGNDEGMLDAIAGGRRESLWYSSPSTTPTHPLQPLAFCPSSSSLSPRLGPSGDPPPRRGTLQGQPGLIQTCAHIFSHFNGFLEKLLKRMICTGAERCPPSPCM